MKTQIAISKLGGGYAGRVELAKLFTEHGYHCTTLNTYRWVDELPMIREFQLRRIKPQWFRVKKEVK